MEIIPGVNQSLSDLHDLRLHKVMPENSVEAAKVSQDGKGEGTEGSVMLRNIRDIGTQCEDIRRKLNET